MSVPFTLPPDYGLEDWKNQAERLTALKYLGFTPRNILDIGAHHGYWAGLAKWIWPESEILSIEASEECRNELEKKGRPFLIETLSNISGETFFNKCETGTGEGNSLFREKSIFPFKQVKVQTKTLEEVIGDRVYDFIKLDCQGAELSILEGTHPKTLENAQAILMECAVQEYNEGAPKMIDVIHQMKLYGFRVFDIIDFHYNSRSMLIQVDILFLPSVSEAFKLKVLS